MKVDPLVVMRGLRPGQGTAWLERGKTRSTYLAFGVREESARITALPRMVETELRAAARLVNTTAGQVLAVPVVLRLGAPDRRGQNLYEFWLNAHALDLPGLRTIAGQDKLVIKLFGDHCELLRTIGCPNSWQDFFRPDCPGDRIQKPVGKRACP